MLWLPKTQHLITNFWGYCRALVKALNREIWQDDKNKAHLRGLQAITSKFCNYQMLPAGWDAIASGVGRMRTNRCDRNVPGSFAGKTYPS